MKIVRKIAILAIAVVAVGAWFQGSDPAALLKEITAFRTQKLTEARAAGGTINAAQLQRDIVEKAKAAVKDVDPAKIDAKQGYEWAQLFQMAEMHKEACDSAMRFIESGPTPEKKFEAQYLMIRSCNSLQEGHMLAMTIGEMVPPTALQGASLAQMTAGMYADTIQKTMGLDAALKALDKVEGHLGGADKLPEAQQPLYYSAVAQVAEARSELLTAAGRKTDALAALDKGIGALPEGHAAARSLKAGKTRMTMMGQPAPALNIERGYGEFTGLESLKGKVVILDFFAHWCGPCIAAFPDMIKLYEEMKPKGLEIVGVTTYYGYYKAENRQARDMAKDVEFGKMKEFIDEHKLPWPVVYGDRSNFEAYAITGIPHVTVLDREGKVHKIKIGYSPALFKAFREDIEKIMAGK